jgi:hypothetical protein
MRYLILAGPVVIGLVMMVALGASMWSRTSQGHNDFVQLYAGGKLALTADLYDRERNLSEIKSLIGFNMETVVYTRPPFYAVILKPLTWLPYRAAYLLFSLVSLGCLVWFCWRFSQESNALTLFAATSVPALAALCNGQDSLLLVALIGGAVLHFRAGREVIAGCLLALCAFKFHLFLIFLPILLILKGKWRAFGGAAATSGVLFVLGLMNGWGSTAAYIGVLRDPWINFKAALMPNLHGLAAHLSIDPAGEWTLYGVTLVLYLWLIRRIESFEMLLGLGLVAGLLLSYHTGLADAVILLPALVLIERNSQQKTLTALFAISQAPILYLMLLYGPPFGAVLPMSLLACMAIAGWRGVRLLRPLCRLFRSSRRVEPK